jgi:hypothetical protein
MTLIRIIAIMGCLLGVATGLRAAATCNASISASTPATEFVDQGNGTITHSRTGLMWKRCAEGQTWSAGTCTGSASGLSWSGALQAAVSARLGGYSDWRLPNVKELQSIVEERCYNPAINESIFPRTRGVYFWSASADASQSNFAWFVLFYDGLSGNNYKDGNFLHVRLVRSGQSFASFDSLAVASSLNVAPGWNLLGNSRSQPLTMAPAFSDQTLVNTVWKWDVSRSAWQFFAPSMDATALQAYASAKGYGVLSVINPGEGFWVNAKRAGALGNLSGAAFGLTAAALQPGWNLVATGSDVSPSAFNRSLSTPPPAAGTIPLNLISLWAWDNALSKWYFYAPALEASGTLSAYTASKGYLDFAATGKTLGDGQGFWVNYAGGSGVASYTIGGTVTGLSGSLVLQNNGGDNFTVSSNGSFAFPTAVAYGSPYSVSVLTQPTGLTCLVSGSSGTVVSNVNSIVVNCKSAIVLTGTGGINTSGQSNYSLYIQETAGTLYTTGESFLPSNIKNSLVAYSGMGTSATVPYSTGSGTGLTFYNLLTADSAGNLWAVKNTSSTTGGWGMLSTAIVKFSNASQASTLAPITIVTLPSNVVVNHRPAFDSHGNLWVDEITLFDPVTRIPGEIASIVEYTAASSYATTGTVIPYSPFERNSGCNGAALAFGSDDHLVTLENYNNGSWGCNTQIREYTPAGIRVTSKYFPAGYAGQTTGELAIDAADNLWVFSSQGPTNCHYPNCSIPGSIYKVSAAGTVLQSISLPSGVYGEVSGGPVFDANGNLWFSTMNTGPQGLPPCSSTYTDSIFELSAGTTTPITALSHTGSCAADPLWVWGLAVVPIPANLPK